MSLSRLTSLLLVTIVSTTLSTAHADETASSDHRSLEISNVHARDIARVLAMTCESGNWEAFAAWTKKAEFFAHDLTDVVAAENTKNGFRFLDSDIEGHVSAKQVEISLHGHRYQGTDGCAALIGYAKDSESKSPTTDEVQKMALAAALSSSMTGVQSMLSQTPTGSALALLEIAFYFSANPERRLMNKMDFEKILSANFAAKCNPTTVIVQTPAHKAIVHRNSPSTVGLFERESDINIIQDKKSLFTTKAAEYVSKLAKTCTTPVGAEDIVRAAEDQVDDSRAKIAAASGEKPAAGDTRVPAANSESEKK